MALKLTLTGGSAERSTRTLSSGTLSIGRGERNDWVLPDPDRHLSKTHCVLSMENGQCVLTDLSTNGVAINGARTPTTRDSRTVLTDGDDFRIGDYTIALSETSEPAAAPARSVDPLDVDPLDDPLGRPPDPSFSHPVHHVPVAARIEDPFDVRDGLQPRRVDPEIDRLAGSVPDREWRGPSQADRADAPRLAVQMPRVVAPPKSALDIDFDALIGDLSDLQPRGAAAPQPAPQPQAPNPRAPQPLALARDPFDDLVTRAPPAPLEPPPPAPSAAVPPRPAPVAPVPPPSSSDASAGLHAFLAGAGVPDATVHGDPEAALRAAGEVFRALTEGLREVLMSRAALKGELRVEQTLLRASNNNALKFSFSPEEAVIALLVAGRPGYMPPMAAAKEAFDDIKSHEIAVVSGMQTALYSLLDRFDPDALEGRIAQGMLSSVLPASRKSRLWDSFRELHKVIKAEAEDDFQAVFGRNFAKAYKAHAQKD